MADIRPETRDILADWFAAHGYEREYVAADQFIGDLRKAGYSVYPSTPGDGERAGVGEGVVVLGRTTKKET